MKNKNFGCDPIVMFIIMALLMAMPQLVHAALPVGSRANPLTVITNSGIVYAGSNSASPLIFTNSLQLSNGASIRVTGAGAITNDGSTALSNLTTRGTHLFGREVLFTVAYTNLTAITNNNIFVGTLALLVVTNTTTSDIIFTGFQGGREGQLLQILNMSPTNLTFLDQSSLSGVTNRLDMMGLGTTNTAGKGAATFIYFNSSSNWILQNFMP